VWSSIIRWTVEVLLLIKYIGAERNTPDIPRVWGEGKTDLIARLQCEIALREKLIGKLERGCTEGACATHRYFIESETEYKKNIDELINR